MIIMRIEYLLLLLKPSFPLATKGCLSSPLLSISKFSRYYTVEKSYKF